MAIKIKKKDGKKEETPEEEPIEPGAAGVAAQLSEEADPFLRASWETASWVEKNRMFVMGGVVVVFLGLVGGYVGLSFLEDQKVQASASLTPAFDSYNTMLEGSKELEAIKANPDIAEPKDVFKDDSERWQAVYAGADTALKQHPTADMALAAKLTKASAAAKLDKHDEAIQLYDEYIKATSDTSMKAAAMQGLATAYASAEKWDDAVKTLDEIGAINKSYASGVRYQKARVLERSGKQEDAKKLYHEILDEDPDHPSKSDIERRLANM